MVNSAGERVCRIDNRLRDTPLLTIIGSGSLGMDGREVAIPYSGLVVSPAHIILPGASQQTVAKWPTYNYR